MDGVVMQEFSTRKVTPVFLISVLPGKGIKLGLRWQPGTQADLPIHFSPRVYGIRL